MAPDNLQKRPNPPVPDQHPGQNALPFTLLSVVVCLAFIGYGLWLLTGVGSAAWLAAFGGLTAAYGALSLFLLACAYRRRAAWCIMTSQVSAVAYLLAYTLLLAAGHPPALGPAGILVAALGLWCNWLAVCRVVRKPG